MRFALFLFALTLHAQTSGVTFRIAIAGGQTQFHMGERIPIDLSFSSSTPAKYSMFNGSPGRWGIEAGMEEFLVSPSEGTSDPLAHYFSGGMVASGPGGMRRLTPEPITVTKDLNQWVRFDAPGTYRLSARSRRVSAGRLPESLTSNPITIRILPFDAAWSASELRNAVAVLRKPAQHEGDTDMHIQAARRIAYLDTPESAVECARLLDDPNSGNLMQLALFATRRREAAIRGMEQMLTAPGQPVTVTFLNALARLKAWSEAQPQRSQAQTRITAELRAKLEESLAAKQPAARAACLKTLAETADGPLSPALRRQLAEVLSELPSWQQTSLLDGMWHRISGPEWLPVLLRAFRDPAAPGDTGLRDIALRRIYQLDPPQGRALILEQIRNPNPRVSFQVLATLPDATLPALDNVLADNLERNQNRRVMEELVARYATVRILPRVKQFYARLDAELRARPKDYVSPACEPPLIAYFLRVEPAYGEKLLRNSLAERSFPVGRCWVSVIGDTARYHASPEWEKVAVEALQDPIPQVKWGAAMALSQRGSPGAVPALWEAFRYWHDWWQNRAAEMNEENRQLERMYVASLARGKNWIATGPELRRIQALCVTSECKGETEQFLRSWTSPVAISASRSGDGGFSVWFGHYNLHSLDDARARLLQLPRETILEWRETNTSTPDLTRWREQIQSDLSPRGVTIRNPAP